MHKNFANQAFIWLRSSVIRTSRARLTELGQGSIEYIGIACVAAVVIAGLISFPFSDKITSGLSRTICGIFSHTSAQAHLPAQLAAINTGRVTLQASSCSLSGDGSAGNEGTDPAQNSSGQGVHNPHVVTPVSNSSNKPADSSPSGTKTSNSAGEPVDVSPQGFTGPFTKRADGFVYDANGKRVPHSNPKKRPSYGEDQVITVWKRDRAQQLEDIKNGDLEVDENGFVPEKLEDNEIYVLDKYGNWRSVKWKEGQSRAKLWDMGHLPGHEFRKLHKKYMDGDISREEFLKEYRNPDNYRVEDPGRNQSHMDEDTSDQ